MSVGLHRLPRRHLLDELAEGHEVLAESKRQLPSFRRSHGVPVGKVVQPGTSVVVPGMILRLRRCRPLARLSRKRRSGRRLGVPGRQPVRVVPERADKGRPRCLEPSTPGCSRRPAVVKGVGMPQNFLACDREQPFLLPPDVWLLEDHLAWFVIDAFGVMDTTAFYAAYRQDGHGRAAYEPPMGPAHAVGRLHQGQQGRRALRDSFIHRRYSASRSRATAPQCPVACVMSFDAERSLVGWTRKRANANAPRERCRRSVS